MTRRWAPNRIVGTVLLALGACLGSERTSKATPLDAEPAAAPSAVDSASVEILWDAPPECPDVDSVKRYAERLLGQSLRAPRVQQVVARARVRRNEAGNWELWLSLTSNDHVAEDTLVAKQCTALGDATALKVALATDPVATARAIEQAAGVTGPEPEPAATSAAPPSHSGAAGDTGGTPVGLRLTVGAGLGLMPGVAGGAALALWLQRSAWRAELAGQGFRGGDAHFDSMPTIGAHLQLFSAIARGCPVPRAGAFEFPICLGLEFGSMHGVGFGVGETETSHSLWGAVVLGPAVRLPVSPAVSFWLEADGVVPLLKPNFGVRYLGTLYTASPASSRIWAGCEIRLTR